MLTVSANKLAFLPRGVYFLHRKLKVLQINDNNFKSLHKDLGNLVRLRCLMIHNNPFCELPTTIHKLADLEEVCLDWFLYLKAPNNAMKVKKYNSSNELSSGGFIIGEL